MKNSFKNPVSGEEAAFTQTAKETNQEKTVVEIKVQPGSLGPPPHYHEAYSETFKVLSGELEIELEGKRQRLKAGETHKVEKFQNHKFGTAEGKSAHIEITLEPGHEGFEQALTILFGLARDGKTDKHGAPKRIADLLSLSELSDSKLKGPLATVVSILRLFIGPKTRAKTRDRLIKQYCLN